MQHITVSFRTDMRRILGVRPARSRWLKRVARRRQRTALRRWLARGDWDRPHVARPVTGWDAV